MAKPTNRELNEELLDWLDGCDPVDAATSFVERQGFEVDPVPEIEDDFDDEALDDIDDAINDESLTALEQNMCDATTEAVWSCYEHENTR